MIKRFKIILIVLILLSGLSAVPANAEIKQTRLPGGVPIVDTQEIAELQARIKNIKKFRPTVALVLSGGGAKGISHVGVIKYLESIGMPIDVILGTSMGGLVGGMYSLGYSSSELEEIIKNIDWNASLTDDIPRDYISYTENKYKEKYILSFPFYYSKEDFLKMRRREDDGYGNNKRYEPIHLGAGGDDPSKLVKENILGSLPSGFIFGQNVSNLLSSLTIGYQDSMKFIDLPIPFICISTEMVTGKAKIWTSGKLTTALRSTMSIPGIYAPVRVDGMVLVDGGMRDNYPTDIAKYLGIDFIIGVDLAQGFRTYNQLNNLADIILQGVTMLGRESYENNLKDSDVTIKPELNEYGMMSFDKESLDTIMKRGYEAAEKQAKNLKALKKRIGSSGLVYNNKRLHINNDKFSISSIRLSGINDRESKHIMDMLHMDVRKKIGKEDLHKAVATIYGTKAFDYVTYELQGREEPYRLDLNCKKGPLHKAGFGARIDTDEIVSVLMNLGWNVHKLQGSVFDFVGKIGMNPYVGLHYYYMGNNGPTFNVTAKFRYVGHTKLNWNESRFNADYSNMKEEIFFSNISWSKFDLKTGLRNDFYKVNSIFTDNKQLEKYDLNSIKNSFVSLFLNARTDTFDSGYFPTKGFTIGIDYSWVFAGLQNKINPFSVLHFDAKTAINFGRMLTVIPSVNARLIIGKGSVPLPYINVVGGSVEGRYMNQQIPFIGVNNLCAAEDIMTVFRTDFRFKLFKNNFLTAIINVADSFPNMVDILSFENRRDFLGIGIEYAYDSIIGPIKANIHWSSVDKRPGIYLSVGYDF